MDRVVVAAVYARKSTDQSMVAEDARSVTRQIDNARAFAESHGWVVPDAHVYVDDGHSGAEFDRRPGLVALLNALKLKPPFSLLVLSDLDRLGREGIETAYLLKRLARVGVRVFTYLDRRELTLDSPQDTLLLQVEAFVASMEREKARQRTTDALTRRAQLGQVTGGRVFGYRNEPVLLTSADGKLQRSHVTRVVDDAEAAVVRQIFEFCSQGWGLTKIAKTLNGRHAACPQPQRGRPKGWAPSSVREVLHRRLYRGEVIWGQTRKRDRWGVVRPSPRDPSEWICRQVPELRIIPEDVWVQAHIRIDQRRGRFGGAHQRRPSSGHRYQVSALRSRSVWLVRR